MLPQGTPPPAPSVHPPGHGRTYAAAARSASSSETSSSRAAGPSWGGKDTTSQVLHRRSRKACTHWPGWPFLGWGGGTPAEDPPSARAGGGSQGSAPGGPSPPHACWGPSALTAGPGGTRTLSFSPARPSFHDPNVNTLNFTNSVLLPETFIVQDGRTADWSRRGLHAMSWASGRSQEP